MVDMHGNHIEQEAQPSQGMSNTDSVVLGGGCFWCTEAVFLNVRGVTSVTPGYSGGEMRDPDYHSVCSGRTGHIEVVNVEFDPSLIDYRTILEIFFATHDPTTLNRQGADVGPQYASAVFYRNDQQREVAEAVMAEVKNEVGKPVVTQIREAETFWPAEPEHHNYYGKHPYQGYCQAVIQPKLTKFRQRYRDWLK